MRIENLHRTTRTRLRTIAAAASVAAALGLTLSACGGGSDQSDGSSQVSSADHNDADVAFATDMIQHHAQALAMVDLTQDRPISAELRKLAEEIRAAQGPEIETMADWLTKWGEDVPSTVRDHANAGHDMGDMGGMDGMDASEMPGMMSDEDMTLLKDASDGDFENMWLTMMIKHHEGAVEMAQTEITDGTYQPAVDTAEQIVEAQQHEIKTMFGMVS